MAEETAEETLDPKDWDSMRALGYRMLDDMMDYLATCSAPGKGSFPKATSTSTPAIRRGLPRIRPIHTPIPNRQ
jgi:hypothetical protein